MTAQTEPRWIRRRANRRVIVDNDFAGDPDGLVALAHQALCRTTQVTLVTSTPVRPQYTGPDERDTTGSLGAARATELLGLIELADPIPVVAGPDTFDGAPGAAAQAIVEEALREDPRPLFFTCGGPLTNLAAALTLEPGIAERMTLVWIGGGEHPDGGWEFNLISDLAAARAVVEDSAMPVWQVPRSAYSLMQYSLARLDRFQSNGTDLTRWLYRHFLNPPEFVELGGCWPLGDSPLVLLTALQTASSPSQDLPARRIADGGRYGDPLPGRTIRVFGSVDARLTFEDMEAVFGL